MQKASVAFVDDNDVITDGENVKENMKLIKTEYNNLHSATGGRIEKEKSKFYVYQ